jgi:hypothetical protein
MLGICPDPLRRTDNEIMGIWATLLWIGSESNLLEVLNYDNIL